MYEQIPAQALAYGKTVAKSAVKANALAVEGMERITQLQLKALEGRIAATGAFWTEAAEIRDPEALKAIWPKGLNLAKETNEKLVANSQEIFAVALKTSEALGQIVRGCFEGAGSAFGKPAGA